MGRLVLGQEVLLVFRRKKASVPLHHDPVVIWSREHWPVLTKVAASCAVPRGQLMYPVALGTNASHFGYGVGMPFHDDPVLQRSKLMGD